MKDIVKNIKENYKLIITVLIIGLFFGWIFFHSSEDAMVYESQAEKHEGHNHESENQATWTCSMHPQIRQSKPGKCPICAMDLVPVKSAASGGDNIDPDEIEMTESAAKLAEIQTINVSKRTPEKSVYLQGKILADERNIAKLTARFGGRIEKLFVNFEGQNVKKGENLATIYSPDLVAAQRELLEGLALKDSRPSIYTAAKGKLKLWDLTDEQISSIEKKGEPHMYFNVLSPISGTVRSRNVSVGDYVKEGASLFEVVDLADVWVLFDAYEIDLPWIRLNDKVNFTVQALPGKEFSSNVTYIDPFINSETRTAKVRVELSNKNRELKPGMFVNGSVKSKISEEAKMIMIPKTSVLWTGKRSVVYVKVPNRNNLSFKYREIIPGPEAGNFYVVVEGLSEGEEVATNGVFKIDAAAQLAGKPSMMNPMGGEESAGHNHSEMDMEQVQSSISPNINEEDALTDTPGAFKKQLTTFYHAYLKMKDAFVASDAAKVSEESKRVSGELKKVDMALLKGDSHKQWLSRLEVMNNMLNEIRKATEIKAQRKAFSKFNPALYNAIETFGIIGVTTYYQFCPMAENNKGAYWLSESEEIINPYFGDAMLHCGETRDIIKPPL